MSFTEDEVENEYGEDDDEWGFYADQQHWQKINEKLFQSTEVIVLDVKLKLFAVSSLPLR